MTIQKQIKQDLSAAIKAKDRLKKDALRVIMGEFNRLDKKELSNEEAVNVMIKLVKSEKELLDKKGIETDSAFINIIENYLPKKASKEEIVQWIRQNIDFSEFKNKMQAMSIIMAHFGASADGNDVRKILQNM